MSFEGFDINENTYLLKLPDVNNILKKGCFRLSFPYGYFNIPLNLPIEIWLTNGFGLLYSFVSNEGIHSNGDYQIFITGEDTWIRYYVDGWKEWKTLNSNSGMSASGVEYGKVPVADGEDGWSWGSLDALYSIKRFWRGKVWVAVGDSLTENNWTASEKYHDLISQNTGITVLNYGKGGTGYGRVYTNSNVTLENFADRVLTIEEPCDVVTIFGSFNDFNLNIELGTVNDTGNTTIGGYMNTTLNNLYNKKPFVSVGIILPTPWQSRLPNGSNANSQKAIQYCELLTAIAEKRGIPVLDLFHNSNLHPEDANFRSTYYSSSDGVHPNNEGHKKIAPMIEQFLKKIIPY